MKYMEKGLSLFREGEVDRAVRSQSRTTVSA